MLLVRKIKSWSVWTTRNDADLERACRDFALRDGESYLSVYRVESREDAEKILICHALAYTTKDDHSDYLLLEEADLGEDLELRHEPDGIPEQDLRARFPAPLVDALQAGHFGLYERQTGALRALASRLLHATEVQVGRVTRDRIRNARS
jgi:regulator of sigma D